MTIFFELENQGSKQILFIKPERVFDVEVPRYPTYKNLISLLFISSHQEITCIRNRKSNSSFCDKPIQCCHEFRKLNNGSRSPHIWSEMLWCYRQGSLHAPTLMISLHCGPKGYFLWISLVKGILKLKTSLLVLEINACLLLTQQRMQRRLIICKMKYAFINHQCSKHVLTFTQNISTKHYTSFCTISSSLDILPQMNKI